jgi:beta-lactamase class A
LTAAQSETPSIKPGTGALSAGPPSVRLPEAVDSDSVLVVPRAVFLLAISLLVAPAARAAEPLEGLQKQLSAIAARAGGTSSIAITHVETARSLSVNDGPALQLFSVWKLPLAVVVLEQVKAGKLRLDQQVRILPGDIAPGFQGNTDRWRDTSKPFSVRELLEASLVASDNTSSDKLLALVGGPSVVNGRMRALGLDRIEIRDPRRDPAVRARQSPHRAPAGALTRLLVRLQKGEILGPAERALLIDCLTRATTGKRRLRARLPPGTAVADKSGTGGDTTNDVGLLTLPGGGHLAVSVLVNGSKLSTEAQEDLIAEIGRAAYDGFVATPAMTRPAGPDFSSIDTPAKAEEACRKGVLEKILMLPADLGGTDDPRNVLYVPVGMGAVKAGIDRNIIQPLISQGKVTRYSARPEYHGKSMVPISLKISAHDPGQFTTDLNLWGEALTRRQGGSP